MCSNVSITILDIRKEGIMSKYYIEIQKLVNDALGELYALHKAGKAIDAPIANNLYLSLIHI